MPALSELERGIQPSFLAECPLDGQSVRQGDIQRIGEKVEVTHLSTWPCRGFAVKMQHESRMLEQISPVRLAVPPDIPQKIDHDNGRKKTGITWWKAAEGSNLLLKLARHRRIQRVVPAVVRPRRDLVDQDATVIQDEEFDPKDSDIVE